MRIARAVALVTLIGFTLSACGLPRPGPTRSEINAGSTERGGDAYIIPVTDQVVAAANLAPASGFSPAFQTGGAINTDVIRRGDVVVVTVYENVEQGVLGAIGAPATINELAVNQDGDIFVPFAGQVSAAGKTIEALRNELTESLAEQTPDPQVLLARSVGDGATVSIISQAGSGIVEIRPSTRRLSEMLAFAGALSAPENATATRVSVARGQLRGTVFLSDLLSNEANDIFVRPGDRITVAQDTRRFTLLGALGGQGLVDFPKPELSVLEAIALAGGLSAISSDPRGIFVFRDEQPEFARSVLGDESIGSTRRVVYVLDFTKPNGIFRARDFQVKDGDTVLVTEAPFSQWTKAINAILSTATTAENLTNIGSTN
ncbi:MAG: polysaccharide biosynthesis/export family protein [Pseudomonadota bacterium]